MNRIKISLACGLLVCSTLASAEFSGNVALTTDYVFRGISQTDNGPAIQGGFDFEHASGFSMGIWGSNVNFGDGDDANVELDYYINLGGKLGKVLNWTVGAIYYDYPSASDIDFYEVNAGLGVGRNFSSLVSYDPDNENLYYEGALKFKFGDEIGLKFHAGYYDFDLGEDYTDWKIAISKGFDSFDFELTYTDTDLDDTDLADDRVVLTVSKSM